MCIYEIAREAIMLSGVPRPSRLPPRSRVTGRADEPIVAVLISLGPTGQTTTFYPQTSTSIHFCLVNQIFSNILTVNLQKKNIWFKTRNTMVAPGGKDRTHKFVKSYKTCLTNTFVALALRGQSVDTGHVSYVPSLVRVRYLLIQ